MWLIIVGVIAVLVLVIAVAVLVQSDDFRITRSARISAPPSVVFGLVNDFHEWNDWSPWAKKDPNAKNTFGGSSSGEGSTFAWAGNSQVGEGNMTIVESRPNELVRIKLEFLKPFACSHNAEFTFSPSGSDTDVSWSMYGKKLLMTKVFSLIMSMDKMLGKDFDKGLAAMKSIAEAKTAAARVQ